VLLPYGLDHRSTIAWMPMDSRYARSRRSPTEHPLVEGLDRAHNFPKPAFRWIFSIAMLAYAGALSNIVARRNSFFARWLAGRVKTVAGTLLIIELGVFERTSL